MNPATAWIIATAGAYLLGSIPVGLLLARSRGIDLRAVGSGNIGATNAMRALGKPLGILCFVLDVAKGAAPTALTDAVLISAPVTGADAWRWLAVAAAAIAGHMFPVWLRFRGGKGVATGLGALLGMWPVLTLPAIAAALLWFATLKLTRYVGVSSCAAAAAIPLLTLANLTLGDAGALPLWTGAMPRTPFLVATALLAAFVIIKHRGNLRRTMQGTEPRVGAGKPPSEKPVPDPQGP
ncbi:MAG: glycerol-3-phosphate 1-O-acyltransferase PlsY [Phycisphaeraceae bacterium]|nr:glycerol-3-phosphate 1-O-acyltransferase PlsY [Phycisphaeraceae bacterium]MCB9847234.1 glycerol-3-phosphate 1-O-acyltransferase PlsY [Phycisphaeraceae bacterium]